MALVNMMIRHVKETVGYKLSRLMGLLVITALLCTSCQKNSHCLEPCITYVPTPKLVHARTSAFSPLTKKEQRYDWAKELHIGITFANELDLYRAITAFKRALALIPREEAERIWQIQYSILLCYYYAGKYNEVVDSFNQSLLIDVPETFPPFRDLLIILADSFYQIEQEERAARIWELLNKADPDAASDLILYRSISEADLEAIYKQAFGCDDKQAVRNFMNEFAFESKSVTKAQTLNAVLPGTGYLYVGQPKSALTSFLINVLFTAAAYKFFEKGYVAAGLITTSLELGWYFGGINGAGLAAKEYNERLYETKAKDTLIQEQLFPILMLHKTF